LDNLIFNAFQLAYHRPNDDIEVLSNPEFLAEGTAVTDLLYPDRVLIGSSSTPRGFAAADVLRNLYSSWIEPSKILTVNVWSSELAKLVANAMLAQRISSINTISAICDRTGADIDEVAFAIGKDTRIGSKFLKAGLGFGGSCFKKDILSLVYLSNSLHLPEVADYWMSVLTVNEFQRNRFMQNVVNKLHGALFGKKITVLGFTFKQDTNDTRESPAVDVIKELLQERPREIAIFDPGCTPTEIITKISGFKSIPGLHAVKPHGPVEAHSNAYDACKDSSAILILTPWNQFAYPPRPGNTDKLTKTLKPVFNPNAGSLAGQKGEMDILELEDYARHITGSNDPLSRLRIQPKCPDNCQACAEGEMPRKVKSTQNVDWTRVAFGMKEPKWVFDGRNLVDCKEMSKLGFRVESLGKGVQGHI
jgi:UDPglucose 6-dehydrogenase